MELARIMKPLMELEYQMHRLYMWFADCFRNDSESRTLFKTMGREELQHRDVIQRQRELIINNFRDYKDVEADLEGIIQLTNLLRDIADQRKVITLKEALRVAIQIEQSAAEHHYRFLLARANPSLVELVKRLSDADKIHVQRLVSFNETIDK